LCDDLSAGVVRTGGGEATLSADRGISFLVARPSGFDGEQDFAAICPQEAIMFPDTTEFKKLVPQLLGQAREQREPQKPPA
jgi:hypothetical protein